MGSRIIDGRVSRRGILRKFRKQDRYAEAVEYYSAALKSDANFALAHAALGDALFRLTRYDEAAISADESRAGEEADGGGTERGISAIAVHRRSW